jgi:transposase InsO family protein
MYVAEVNKDLQSLIQRIQSEDPETRRRKAAVEQKLTGNKGWSVTPDGLVRFKGRMYILSRENLRWNLISLHHDDPLAGHFGRNRTEQLLKRKFHWTNLQRDVAEYVKECPICQEVAAPRHRLYGNLQSLPIPSRPFVKLSIDFITGLPAVFYQTEMVDAILVIVDHFSKWSLFIPVSSTINAAELADLFYNKVELRFGPPNGIVSNRGPIFTSKFWSKLCYLSYIKLRLSTAFHPQTNGQTERVNQTLEHYLRCFIDEQQTNWPSLLPTAEFACNNAHNATTGFSPFEVLLGYAPDFRLRTEDGTASGEIPAAKARVEKLNDVHQQLQRHWRKAVEAQVKHYNKHHQPI